MQATPRKGLIEPFLDRSYQAQGHGFEIAKSAANIRASFRCMEFIDNIDGAHNCTLRYDEEKVRALSEFIEVWNINHPLEVVSKRSLATRWHFFNKGAFKNYNYNFSF
jgi:hypothetical protein